MKREDLNFILQEASLDSIKEIVESIKKAFKVEILLAPTQQMLLLPVKDPISEGIFYGGEVLVTSSLVCLSALDSVLDSSLKSQGWAMVLDDNAEYALNLAIIDSYVGLGLQDSVTCAIFDLAHATKESIEFKRKEKNKRVDSTRVQFELM